MSLYNLMHGENPMADALLAILGLARSDIPRYRDCYWTGEHIAIHTRTGGGNREAYESGNEFLQSLPGFVRDADDEFDSTYATFYFKVPETLTDITSSLVAADATPAQKWETLFEKLKTADPSDPQVARAMSVMAPIMTAITEAVNKKGNA